MYICEAHWQDGSETACESLDEAVALARNIIAIHPTAAVFVHGDGIAFGVPPEPVEVEA